jgi:hypothetical protein
VALSYIEENKWTNGWTYIFIKSPSTDLGFWYNNLRASRDELKALPNISTQLERSNMLMKLRESIIEHGGKDSIRYPDHLPFYPNSGFWILMKIGALLFSCIGVIIMIGNWCSDTAIVEVLIAALIILIILAIPLI